MSLTGFKNFLESNKNTLAVNTGIAGGGLGISVASGGDANSIGKEAVGAALDMGIDIGLDAAKAASKIGVKEAAKQTASKAASKIAAKIGVKIATSVSQQGATMVASAAIPLIGWVLVIVQLVGMILDLAWNPYKNYFNKDLEDIKKSIDDGLKSYTRQIGLNYPLEVKPTIITNCPKMEKDTCLCKEIDTEPECIVYNDFQNDMKNSVKEYFQDNNLVSPQDAILTSELTKARKLFRRVNKLFKLNPKTKEYEIGNPLFEAVLELSQYENEALLMIAMVIKQRKLQKPTGFFTTSLWKFLVENMYAISCYSCLIILCISSSISSGLSV